MKTARVQDLTFGNGVTGVFPNVRRWSWRVVRSHQAGVAMQRSTRVQEESRIRKDRGGVSTRAVLLLARIDFPSRTET